MSAPRAERPSFQSAGVSDDLRRALLAFVRSRVRDAHAAEDLTQEILVRATTKRETVRSLDKLDAWLFQIARNAVTDHFRRARPTEEFDPETHGEPATDAGEGALREALAAYVRDVVHDLPPLYRDALQLTDYEGISQVELARRAGISVSAAKSRVQRARAAARKIIEEHCQFTTDRYGTVTACEPRKDSPCRGC